MTRWPIRKDGIRREGLGTLGRQRHGRCIAASAVAAPWLAPHDANASGIDMLALPNAAHWLGTDELGRDVLSRVIDGARVVGDRFRRRAGL